MSFSHKAFAFEWVAFEKELAPTLGQALKANDTAALEAFIERYREELRDPYEGEPLPPGWRSMLEAGDVQELGDFALTRYYLPKRDFGLSDEWTGLYEELTDVVRIALLGDAFGESGDNFDPGRMGSYFQTPARAAESFKVLGACGHSGLQGFIDALSKAVDTRKGLYVTF